MDIKKYYKNKKKIFAFEKLYNIGFLNHLLSLKNATTVIIFGSFARSDWYKESDVDLFIYGDAKGLKIVNYELELHKEIQVFICKNKDDLIKLGSGLLRNIIKGNIIKGNIDFPINKYTYHLPGCTQYETAIVQEDKGEQWFCTEAEARKAGYTKAKTCR